MPPRGRPGGLGPGPDPPACDRCPTGSNDQLGALQRDSAVDGVDEDCQWGDAFQLNDPTPGTVGVPNNWAVSGATANQTVALVGALQAGSTAVPQCPGMVLPFSGAVLVDTAVAAANGTATLSATVPPTVSRRNARFIAVQVPSCRVSDLETYRFP